MEGKSNIFGILCFIVSRKVNMQLKCKKKKTHCAVYGHDWTYQKWFAKFYAENLLLDNAPLSGRTVEVDNNQIKTLIVIKQCYTMWEIAGILKISK